LAASAAGQKLLSWDDLHALGIRYHRNHLHKLIAAGRFPAPVKLGEGRTGSVAFVADEVQQWIEDRVSKYRVTYHRDGGRS
jgi:predicted DNA-binding transcriptional regulator AlpA